MRGGGSKTVWDFSENLSDLVPPSFPYHTLYSLIVRQQLMSFIIGPAKACPSSYVYKAGDVDGYDTVGKRTSVSNIATCAKYCDNDSACCSFEYSPRRKWCNLNKECGPTHGVYQDFDFCVKGKRVLHL